MFCRHPHLTYLHLLFLHQHPNLIHPPNFEVLMTPCLRCVSRRKWELLTAWASIPVPLTWLIFSLIYWALGGTNYDGDNFIYPVLKFVVVIALMMPLMATLHCKCHHLFWNHGSRRVQGGEVLHPPTYTHTLVIIFTTTRWGESPGQAVGVTFLALAALPLLHCFLATLTMARCTHNHMP